MGKARDRVLGRACRGVRSRVWGSAGAVDAGEVVGGGGEGELDGHLVERAQTELAQAALLFEHSEDRLDDGFALAVEAPALFGAHLLAHAAQAGVVAAKVVCLVSKIQLPRQ